MAFLAVVEELAVQYVQTVLQSYQPVVWVEAFLILLLVVLESLCLKTVISDILPGEVVGQVALEIHPDHTLMF